MTEHVLIHKQTAGRPCGPDALLAWTCFRCYDSDRRFRRRGDDQLHNLALVEASRAIECGFNLTIAWGPFDPSVTPVEFLEEYFRSVRPVMLFCPEQARLPDVWVSSNMCGSTGSLPVTAVQAQLTRTVEDLYPRWQSRGGIRPDIWSATALLVHHDMTALDLGLVELAQLTPDDRLGHVANDPQVRDAVRASDPALPETMAALVHARLAAQARAGIAAPDRAPIYSSDVESLLTPIVFRMTRGDGPDALDALRQDLQRQYLDMGDVVLTHALHVYPHGGAGIDALREAAREMPAASAA